MSSGTYLAMQLRSCAEHIEKYDKAIWNAVCCALDRGNPKWCADSVGYSAEEMAIKEIERLYGLEQSLRLALQTAGESK